MRKSRAAGTRPGRASSPGLPRAGLAWAALAGGLSVATHVVGKSVRDALFLAALPVELLPAFIVGAGAASVVAVSAYTRASAAFSPRRAAPAVGVLLAALAALVFSVEEGAPRLAAGLLYLAVTVLGTLLTSGFWAVLAERLDPRQARQLVGVLGAATTAGGLAGGALAHALVRLGGETPLLPALAALALATSFALVRTAGRRREGREKAASARPAPSGLRGGAREIAGSPLLRSAALLVAGASVAGTISDYMLKDAAARAWSSKAELASFFSLFHGAVGALTFGVQLLVCRPLVARKGLRLALAALPAWLAVGAALAGIAPGIAAVTALRAGDGAFRNTFFRAGYELLFLPLSPERARVVKPILDTLVERAADVAGAALLFVSTFLLGLAPSRLAWVVAAAGLALLALSRRAARGYVATLEENLAARAVEIDALASAAGADATTRETLRLSLTGPGGDGLRRTLGRTPLGAELVATLAAGRAPPSSGDARGRGRARAETHGAQEARAETQGDARATPSSAPRSPGRAARAVPPVVATIEELVAGDPELARRALASLDWRDRRLVPFVIELLGRDELAEPARAALVRAGDRVVGTLSDTLADPGEPVLVRRRIPAVLSACGGRPALEALLGGLADPRFEVREASGAALRRRQEAGLGEPPAEGAVWAAILAELRRPGLAGPRPGRASGSSSSARPEVAEPDEAALSGGDPRLRHVFRLLGLVRDPGAVSLAWRALRGGDPRFRAVALEYLDNVLPEAARRALFPLLEVPEEPAQPSARSRPLAEVVADLRATGSGPRG